MSVLLHGQCKRSPDWHLFIGPYLSILGMGWLLWVSTVFLLIAGLLSMMLVTVKSPSLNRAVKLSQKPTYPL